ncbi:MAG: phospholipase D-like domain-containing protein [Verrucomicrobiota bacterium]
MSPQQLDDLLAQTLTDRRVSTGEKRALNQILAEAKLTEQQRALLRHRAFELARQELADPRAQEVLEWLAEVNKLLLPPAGASAAPVIEALFSPGTVCTCRIIDLLAAAQRSVDLCVFTIADDRISSAILGAHRRKVAVRIISDDQKAHDAGSDIEQFRRAGIKVKLDRSPDHMHHKFAVFDAARVLTGSFNWTRSAAEANQENIIVSNDGRLVSAFAGEFEKLWNGL